MEFAGLELGRFALGELGREDFGGTAGGDEYIFPVSLPRLDCGLCLLSEVLLLFKDSATLSEFSDANTLEVDLKIDLDVFSIVSGLPSPSRQPASVLIGLSLMFLLVSLLASRLEGGELSIA